MNLADIVAVYHGSDADRTRALYALLETFAPRGPVAVKLLQACKASERAKMYSRSRWRHAAYDKKDWAIGELCRSLVASADELGIAWGWARDPKSVGFEDVIYIDVPGCGQVSFHTSYRRDGPDYAGSWDGVRGGAPDRICRWAEAVLAGREATSEGEQHGSRDDRNEGGPAAGVGEEQAGPAEPDSREQQQTFDL